MKSLQKGPTNQIVGERCSENIRRWENAPLMKFKGVDLKNKGQLFYQQKTVFIQEQQRIAIQDMQLWQNHRQVWRTKERTIILQRKGEFGRSFHNTKPLEETGNSKCSGFSLAGLWLSLIGWAIARGGENLSPSWQGIRAENIFLLEVQGIFLFGAIKDEWQGPPVGSPNSNLG